jgi:hypothetical protein
MPHPVEGNSGETSDDPLLPTQVPAMATHSTLAAESYAIAAARDAVRRSTDDSTPTPHVAPHVAPLTDFSMPAIGGLLIGAIAHSVLSTDLSEPAAARPSALNHPSAHS